MGFLQTEESKRMEIEELRRMLVACAGLNRRKDDEEFRGLRVKMNSDEDDNRRDKVVCVTSGVSFLSLAIVNKLLLRGYSVRIIVDNQEDIEKLREMESSGEMRTYNNNLSVVTAKLTDVEDVVEAFEGCCGIFHTSAFVDPVGLSGYSKCMAEIEVKATESVMKACARTSSVRNCVLTSSLLACIWRDGTKQDLSKVVNQDCWSDESLCINKKLWYALGKLKSEKTAWQIAEEGGLKLATICPGLITGPDFIQRNPTATIAYLKGAQEMYANGLLATVDVNRLAEAHVCVYEAMKKTGFGRYICFDKVIKREDEAEKLESQVGMPKNKLSGNTNVISMPFELSNKKLSSLMSRTLRPCYNQF
ncbi:cinnamoyl-CoA reductase-like SNL6 [Mangifera indica]|uniref:cinnamoyl-CoA reductase-like SNL6 n=1 Tax=Mangifera indica TaxID=29780 RepID=UPI001CFAC678|nr:cinnamoyl-CoA reductase-like SNL6 [Mangifera indica]